jgi:hypothetical protein
MNSRFIRNDLSSFPKNSQFNGGTMDKHRLFITICMALVLAVLTCVVDVGHAQQSQSDNKLSRAVADSLRERAERVQERRKGRITQAQREAAAARAKAARAKSIPAQNGLIDGGKGVVK